MIVNWPEAWKHAGSLKGSYTDKQGHVLYERAKNSKLILEIGSAHGRSTSILLSTGNKVVSIDPHYDDNTYEEFICNMQSHPNWHNLSIYREFDYKIAEYWTQEIDFLHLDADCIYLNEYQKVKSMISRWKPFAKKVLVHHIEQLDSLRACTESGLVLKNVGALMGLGSFYKLY